MTVRQEIAEGITPAHAIVEGLGGVGRLPELTACPARRALVVASPRVVRSVPPVRALIDSGARHFGMIRANPTHDQVELLARVVDRTGPEVIVAVGGGSAIDLAKAARMIVPGADGFRRALSGDPAALVARPPRLIAVPTTAGTGAEHTPFATVYVDGRKTSLDLPRAVPDIAVLDGDLVYGMPPRFAFAAHLDALCHGIESAWSRAATGRSRRRALAALAALVDNPPDAGTGLTPAGAHRRLLAAAVAGLAIAETRTTAAHAFSYWVTANRGTDHGFACAEAMNWVAELNHAHREATTPELQAVFATLGAGEETPGSPVAEVRRLLGIAERRGWYRPTSFDTTTLAGYVESGLGVRGRVDNNPIELHRQDIIDRLTAVPVPAC